MKGTWVVALLVVASMAGAAIQTDGSDCPIEIGESDEPGEELANVVGAQESVVAREIERRGFNATLANASDREERATIVATELERIEVRLASLETCRDALVDAREDGDLSDEEYGERAGTLESEIVDVRERLDRAAEAASDLPQSLREETDIESERFDALATRVDDLEAWIGNPDRAIESVEDSEHETTVRESTTDEPADEEPTEPPPTTSAPETTAPDTTLPSDGTSDDDGNEGASESGDGSNGSDVNF